MYLFFVNVLLLFFYLGKYEPINKIYSNELSNIIARLLTVNYEKRPDTNKLLNDPIIIRKINEFTNRLNLNLIDETLDKEMLDTIKFSPLISELNKNLPKIKRYSFLSRSDNKLTTYKNNLVLEESNSKNSKEKNSNK